MTAVRVHCPAHASGLQQGDPYVGPPQHELPVAAIPWSQALVSALALVPAPVQALVTAHHDTLLRAVLSHVLLGGGVDEVHRDGRVLRGRMAHVLQDRAAERRHS